MLQKECKSIWKYKHDKAYICDLLEQIENQNLRKRIAHELCTYADGAYKYKVLYKFSQCVVLLLPQVVLGLMLFTDVNQHIQALLTGLITAVSGISGAFAFYSKWQHYRTFCEITKQEVYRCVLGIDTYSNSEKKEKERRLGVKFEEIVSKEGQIWKQIGKKQEKA